MNKKIFQNKMNAAKRVNNEIKKCSNRTTVSHFDSSRSAVYHYFHYSRRTNGIRNAQKRTSFDFNDKMRLFR